MDTTVNLTADSAALFTALIEDAGNWSGQPLIGGNVEMTKARKGNLTDLVKKGLLTVVDDGEGHTYAAFTMAGVELAAAMGLPDAGWLSQMLGEEAAPVNHEGDATPTAEDDAAMDMEPAATPVTTTVEASPAEPARDRRNGILYPAEGSVSAKIWALADAFVAQHGREPKPADLKDAATAQGINLTSLGLGMSYRRRFYRAG